MALGRYQRLEMWDSQIDRIDVESGYKTEKLREPWDYNFTLDGGLYIPTGIDRSNTAFHLPGTGVHGTVASETLGQRRQPISIMSEPGMK
jgi:hypothetical protein